MTNKLANILKNTARAALLAGIVYSTAGCIMPDHKHCHHPPSSGSNSNSNFSYETGPRGYNYSPAHSVQDHGTAISREGIRIKLF